MYTVKQLSPKEFQISLFEDHKEPEKIYKVSIRNHSYYCTCPGWMKTPGINHKHVKIIRAWIQAGSPWLAAIENGDSITVSTHIPCPKER